MTDRPRSSEVHLQPTSGWPVLITLILLVCGAIALAIVIGNTDVPNPFIALTLIPTALLLILTLCGFYLVNPNMSRVLVLFGKYRGTARTQGLFWTNPFTIKHQVSLKAINVASETIKVNDLGGNPIEIGAVVVWLVKDTAQALFDVEDYPQYVDIQIETAIRQLASAHPYDENQEKEGLVSLRGDSVQVAEELKVALAERLDRAGIEVIEARLSHLAYAPEIASAMLQRQQAEAIIAARQKIVEGAVGMVEQALSALGERGVVELDDERRATLVGNLLVVLCGQASPQPVLNTGSLYT
jgi:regulator of protease activity HflC (stomatin/prohibitin superfamily)